MVYAVITVLMMAVVVSVMYFFMFFDVPFLTYENLPFPANLKVVEAGRPMPLTVRRCNKSRAPRTYFTTHSLEDMDRHVYWLLPSVQVYIGVGCATSTSLLNRIPSEVPSGTYRLVGIAEVRGVLRTHAVDWYSEPFKVIARKSAEEPQ